MKRNFVALAVLIISSALSQGQTTTTAPSTPPAGGQSGALRNNSVRGQSSSQLNPSQPGVGGGEGTIFNQPAGANRTQPAPFGGTNQGNFGSANSPAFGTTNSATFGGTNQVAFGTTNTPFGGTNSAVVTNGVSPVAGQGSPINEAAGATTNQTAQTGAGPADQAFALQLRAALAKPGATQIYFPQTRSTVTMMNQNGAVTLQGFVSSEAEKQSIEARIKGAPGVSSVNNQLQVGSGQRGITPRTPGINPAPNSATDRQLLNP